MVPFIYSPREVHSVRTPAEYQARHAEAIAKRQAGGSRVSVHVSTVPVVARIDANRWLIDCECGAGNATDPDWQIAYCYGCGAVHTAITFPTSADRALIEAVLTAWPRVERRGWNPSETVDDLVAQSAAIRADVPAHVTTELAAQREAFWQDLGRSDDTKADT